METTTNQKDANELNSNAVSTRQFNPNDLIDDGKLIKLLYSIAETAFLLDASEKTIRRFIERNLLLTSKGQRHVKVTRDSIMAFMKATV